MRRNLLPVIVTAILLITIFQPAFAIPRAAPPLPATSPMNSAEMHTKIQGSVSKVRERIGIVFSDHSGTKKRKASWRGFVSLGCSLAGFISMIVAFSSLTFTVGWASLAVVAFVFGVLAGGAGIAFGIKCLHHKRNKFRGFAIAGIILGGIEVFLLLLAVMIAGGAFV